MTIAERLATTRPPPWLFSLVYGLHLLDEAFAFSGLPRWATQNGFWLTTFHWLSVSLLSFLLFSTAVWLVARATWPSWLLVALAVHITLHALMHVAAALWALSLSPGMISGIVLALPLALWTFAWASQALSRRVFAGSAILGAATFQAPWDMGIRLLFGLQVWTV